MDKELKEIIDAMVKTDSEHLKSSMDDITNHMKDFINNYTK